MSLRKVTKKGKHYVIVQLFKPLYLRNYGVFCVETCTVCIKQPQVVETLTSSHRTQ